MALLILQQLTGQTTDFLTLSWHGNTEEALGRLSDLIMDLGLIQACSGAAKKLGESICEFHTYIRNNQEYISNYGELYRQGETITTSFVESTINQVGVWTGYGQN
jgi:hypothetical protein